jgi:hypothetical protein
LFQVEALDFLLTSRNAAFAKENMSLSNNFRNSLENGKEKRNTEAIYKQSNALLILIRTMLQPPNDTATQQDNNDEQQNPACGLDFPANRFHLFLLAYP